MSNREMMSQDKAFKRKVQMAVGRMARDKRFGAARACMAFENWSSKEYTGDIFNSNDYVKVFTED